MIASVDEFILYDDMQFTRRDWRNRNKIKTPHGLKWLTVPVKVKGRFHQKIKETEIIGTDWADSHSELLSQNYRRSPCYSDIIEWIKPLYLTSSQCNYISQMNRQFIESVCDYLGIETAITNSWDYNLSDGRTERLADLCEQAGGSEYVSGPAAKDYIEESEFTRRGIKLTWFDYSGYPEYSQLWGSFVHEVTILDLLFNCGRDSHRYMKYVRP